MPIPLSSLGLPALKDLALELEISYIDTKDEVFAAVEAVFKLKGFDVNDVLSVSRGKVNVPSAMPNAVPPALSIPVARGLQLRQPDKFDMSSDRRGKRWTSWLKEFVAYSTAVGLGNDFQKSAVLLHWAGPDVQKVADALGLSSSSQYSDIVMTLSQHFSGAIPMPMPVF